MPRFALLPFALTLAVSFTCPESQAETTDELKARAHALLEGEQLPAAEAILRTELAAAVSEEGPESDAALEWRLLLSKNLIDQNLWREQAALDFIRETHELARSLHAAGHRARIAAANRWGVALDLAGRGERGRALYRVVIEEQSLTYGSISEKVAFTLGNIAASHADEGDFGAARKVWQEAEALSAQLESKELHMSVFSAWASMESRSGNLAKALELIRHAEALSKKPEYAPHAEPGLLSHNMGAIRRQMGDYLGARDSLEQALEERREAYGPKSDEVAMTLGTLAEVAQFLGDLEAARKLYEQSAAIRRERSPGGSPQLAFTLINLGGLLANKLEDYEAARLVLDETVRILTNEFGPEHGYMVYPLANLALIDCKQGRFERCRETCLKATEIGEKRLGAGHPLMAGVYLRHGSAERGLGNLDAARELYEKALGLSVDSLGPDHPEGLPRYNFAADMALMQGDLEAALARSLEGERIRRQHLRLTAHGLSEQEALTYGGQYRELIAPAFHAALADPAAVEPLWDAVIRSRALVLDVMAERLALAHSEPELHPLIQARSDAARALTEQLTGRPQGMPAEQHASLIDEARAVLEKAERALAKASMEMGRRRAESVTGFSEVAAALPEGEALVAYERFRAVTGYDEAGLPTRATTMVALVLPGGASMPRILDLGPEEDLQGLVEAWRGAVTVPSDGAGARATGEALRSAAWDPVEELLADATRVHVVPAGVMHLVNLAALPARGGGWLIEADRSFHQVSTERDLVGAGHHATEAGGGLLALGGADFDRLTGSDAVQPWEQVAKSAQAMLAMVFRGANSGCADFADLRFGDLPGTRREAQAVSRSWRAHARRSGRSPKTVLLQGGAATEEAFKTKAPGRSVLHVATHGFFLGDCSEAADGTRGIHGVGSTADDAADDAGSESPLLRSGLALSGFNRRSEAGDGQEDGVLTAEEISSLDLSATQWAVLSACESGRGAIEVGEGVLGLQRAFRVAGVDTIIMSLWAVDDDSTASWMEELYEARLARGRDTADCVREAGLALLTRRRAAGLSESPFYWGAFVGSGDAR